MDNQPHQSLHTLIPLTHEPENHSANEPDEEDLIDHRHDQDDDDDDNEQDDDHLIDNLSEHLSNHVVLQTNGKHMENGQNLNEIPQTNGTEQLDIKASDSLTLEDIDEVLSNGTNNNWIEDSAGVIGTQEVYNDPRHKIVRERERPNPSVNIEKLSFQEKLKMFNESAEK